MNGIDRRVLLASLGAAGGSFLAGAALAGDLNPPAGPIGPTMKRLDEVEPRTAVQHLSGTPAALYLIDRPGSFFLTSDVQGEPGRHGIEIASDDVTIDLCGFTLAGVIYSGSAINASAAYRRIVVCNGRVVGWRTDGVSLGQCEECIVEHLLVSGIAHTGIAAGSMGVVRACEARDCSFIGVSAGPRSQVAGCRASGGATGIKTGSGSVIARCTATGATGIGLELADGDQQLHWSSAVQCATGIAVDGGNHVRFASVGGCTANGFHVRGTRNLVSDCQAVGNGKGFLVAAAANLLVRNAASGNTQNYSIVAGNTYGPLVNAAGAGDLGTVTGGNHPWANFSY
jgi:hypothetical protein